MGSWEEDCRVGGGGFSCSGLGVWIYETLPTVYILLSSDNEQLEELDVCDCVLLAS